MSVEQNKMKRKNRSIPNFLQKAYQILEDSSNNYAIKWTDDGKGFIVINEDLFSREVLPKYFRHSNYSSFVRQLNMYNFHKLKKNNLQNHFYHQFFRKNHSHLLEEIKRKPQKKKRKNEQQMQKQDQMEEYSSYSIKNSQMKHKKREQTKEKGQSEAKIKSLSSTDKKLFQNTHHFFLSEKENIHQNISDIFLQDRMGGDNNRIDPNRSESKQRVSIQNILSNSMDNDDDKISINNQIAEMFPRCPTKQFFYPSNHNIYPFPVNFKSNAISQINILF